MGYFQSNKIIKLIFLLIWPFFILRIPTYFKIQENFSQFDITNIKNLTLLSMDIALLFIFCFLIFIQIIDFFKHRIISKSIILIIYPIIGVIGYYVSGYKNLYQEHILLHHFITLSATFLFFSFIQSNKLFDYKFKELCLKIILSIIFIYFLSIILPSIVIKLYLGQDLRFGFINSIYIFSNEINFKQNINGQTKFMFILFIFTMVLFRKFYSNKKKKSYLFFLIGLILITLIYLTQSRLNIFATFIFSIFIITSFKDLNLKNKLSFLILIFTVPFFVFNITDTIPNRFIDQYRVVMPIDIPQQNKLGELGELDNILNSKILNEDNKINYDVYLDQFRFYKEIKRMKNEQPLLDHSSNSYRNTVLANSVSYNKNIVLGKCLDTLIILDSILSGRLCGWQILFDIIEKPELIFGKGFFADQVYLKPIEKVASNSFINILFNTGLISLLIYIAIILIFFSKYFKFKNLNHTNIYISISHYYFIYFIFRSFFEDTLAFVSLDLLLLGSVSILIKHYSQRANN